MALDWDSFNRHYNNQKDPAGSQQFKEYLSGFTKKEIFTFIKTMTVQEREHRRNGEKAQEMKLDNLRINWLLQCLDINTALGQRFWTQEGFIPCNMERGYLNIIWTYLINALTLRIKPEETPALELFELHSGLAYVYSLQNKTREAINEYCKALRYETSADRKAVANANYYLAKNYAIMTDNESLRDSLLIYRKAFHLNPELSFHEYNKMLAHKSKESLFNAIMLIEDPVQKLVLLNEAIRPSDSKIPHVDENAQKTLGSRFWQQEGFLPCDLNKGYLGKIGKEMERLYKERIVSLESENNPEAAGRLAVALGRLYRAQGNYAMVVNIFGTPQIAATPYAILQRAEAQCRIGKYSAAEEAYGLLLQKDPVNPVNHQKTALFYHQMFKRNFGFFNKPACLGKAVYHFIQACILSDDPRFASNFTALLNAESKQNILAAIKSSQGKSWEISYAWAKDKNNLLGQRFWKQEGFYACKMGSGTLGKIQALMDLTPIDSPIPVTGDDYGYISTSYSSEESWSNDL